MTITIILSEQLPWQWIRASHIKTHLVDFGLEGTQLLRVREADILAWRDGIDKFNATALACLDQATNAHCTGGKGSTQSPILHGQIRKSENPK